MNISKESTGDLTATITIEINKEDYDELVTKDLKERQKSAAMPGFRPGKVPFGIIKKQYGRAVLADTINSQLSENITKFITDNELNVLGSPLPSNEKETLIDFDNDSDFTFHFDIGLSPEFELNVGDNLNVDYYEIKPDKEMINKYIDDVRKRFGEHHHPETAEENDVLEGEMVELDENGEEKENGIRSTTSIAIDLIKSKVDKNKFIGSKAGDIVTFNPMKATENATETALMLNIQKEEAELLESDFRFTINNITRHAPAELNEELFKKVFGEETDTEKKFNDKIKEVIQRSFEPDTDRFFMNNAIEKLIEDTNISLPDEFMKRLLKENDGEQKITDEQIETQYDNYAKSIKWQMIEGRIIKEHDIKVEESEIRDVVRNYFQSQMMMNTEDEESKQRIESIIDSVLSNKEEANRIYGQLLDQKMNDFLKENLKLDKKKVSYDDFVKLVSENQPQQQPAV